MQSSIPRRSPFFHTPAKTSVGDLAVLHLKRDNLIPIILKDTADDGYAEGAVTNTRFGSFPHSTLLGLDWGSQVRASKVDTGTRGRKAQRKVEAAKRDEQHDSLQGDQNKRKREEGDAQHKAAVQAGSGFLHILPPTPESWTYSLDHRTQVVYTPDYSYVLQRLRVRPGSRLIEAGAGSGSFTHAAARAVFLGYPSANSEDIPNDGIGRIFSYEYHEPRVDTLRQELADHGLDGIVNLTQRDVCNDGFLLPDGTSPQADAIFLDLPAPWVALRHLTRSVAQSPLTSDSTVHICTFSPCIEQVQVTMSTMREMGWVDVEMVEVAHRRIDVRRDRVGLKEEGLRGVNAVAATVEEAIERQREVEKKLEVFHESKKVRQLEDRKVKHEEVAERKLYKEGNLVHRTEPEVKTHTSYLVFATLPREWSQADEEAMLAQWSVDDKMMRPAQNGSSKGRKGGEPNSNKAQKKGKVSVS
ncbi:tRNA methyltransferase complex GCD14 subunit [Polychaeton citri CBS 116435]|uniref:tRNA (adenine(58)-N(1))-methyltransferase catalytic subunit TRM61 n=1 Tax=Polychaeton citri CBS 116435 TaxID=1314669 RepID=A0A9P4UPC4_9PEZI|nr:tRNA methyltransferase complex GCD14 subunit [Polychaeton citri CBS 116435]